MKTTTLTLLALVCFASQGCLSSAFNKTESQKAKTVSEPAVAKSAGEIADDELPPKAIITDKDGHEIPDGLVVRMGKLIMMDSGQSIGQVSQWSIDTSDVKVPDEPTDEVLEYNAQVLRDLGATVHMPNSGETLYNTCGDSVYFASYPGTIRVHLFVVSMIDGELKTDVTSKVIVVTGSDPPDDDDDPDDDPPSDPPSDPPPSSGFGLAPQVPGWLATVPTGSRGEADLIKQVLTANAKLAADGKYRTILEMQAAIGAGLSAAIKDTDGWGKFGQSFVGALDSLIRSKEIKTPEDFGKAINEVAGAM